MLIGIPLEVCQHIFWTLVISTIVSGGLLLAIYHGTSSGTTTNTSDDPWIIPAALTLVVCFLSIVAGAIDAIALILYAIWN